MKTVLLVLTLIAAAMALVVLRPLVRAAGSELEPGAIPPDPFHAAPVIALERPATLDAPELVPTLDLTPGETREAFSRDVNTPLLGGGQQPAAIDPSVLNVLDLLESGATLSSTGTITINDSGRIVLGRGGTILGNDRTITKIVFSGVREDRPDGTWVENHDEGKPKVQGQIRNGLEVGLWIYWHENGERSAEGRYVNGKRHGLWTTWHADGSKESEGIYSYGKREGSWIDFHPGGTKLQVAAFVNGEFEGRVARWHANGTRESEGFCVSGDLDAPWRGWYPTGATSSHGDYRYGIRVGRWTFLDADGELNESRSGRYENGEKVAD